MQNQSIPDPVLWHEGMPLLPQHFQQEFIRVQSLVQTQLDILGNYNYGIMDIEIDKMELIKNILKINKIFVIMPDGMVIKIENNNEYNLQCNLPDPSSSEKQQLSMYLTIPKLISENYILGKYPRYTKSISMNVFDIHSGQDPVQISRMLPNISLCSELELNSNYTAIKVVQLKLEKNLWDIGDYIAPSMKINSSNPIYEICSEICYALRKKINYLADLIYSQGVERQASFISENFFYSLGLGAGLPYLEGLLSTHQAHPFQLYLGLCNVLGGLGLLTKKMTPPFPQAYQHDELLLTFHRIKKDIEDIVNLVINEKIITLDFKKEDDVYSIELKKEYIKNNTIYLGFKKKLNCLEADLFYWIKNSIICNDKKTAQTINNRVLGYTREHIDKTEEILPTRGVYLFKLTVDDFENLIEKISLFNLDDKVNFPEEIFVYIHKDKDPA